MDHGIRTSAQLRSRGFRRGDIDRAIDAGALSRVVRGWYARPGAWPDAVAALQRGGRLGCVSLLSATGAWRPEDDRLHLAMPANSDGRREHDASVRHWSIDGVFPARSAVSPPELAISHLLQCQPPEIAVAVLDSLVFRRIVPEHWLHDVLRRSSDGRALLPSLDPAAEQGMESIARYRFVQAGLSVRSQVPVRGFARKDLELEGWLGVELDGREHHAQAEAFTKDRTRDGRLVQLHHDSLHFGYFHVMHDWAFVMDTVNAALLRRPSTRLVALHQPDTPSIRLVR